MRRVRVLIFALLLIGGFVFKSRAVGVADIDAILQVSGDIDQDNKSLTRLARQLVELRDQNFSFAVGDSTQTITLNSAQRQGLIARYGDLKSQLITDVGRLP